VKADKQHIDNDELLVKYLAGEASAGEQVLAETWIAASLHNREYFEHFKFLWDESQKLAHVSNINEDLAWNRFRERIKKEYSETTKPKSNFQWIKVAAIILLVSAVALFGPYFFTHHNDIRYTSTAVNKPADNLVRTATADNTRIDTLSDGSVITLNKYSSLNYPPAFPGSSRNVELTGEAFFNIKHDPDKPFVIKANNVLVTVLGTSFNVKAVGDKTEVIVETGIVSVKKQTHIVSLYPGEKLTVYKTDTTLRKELNKDTLYRAYRYKNRVHAFKNRTLAKKDTPFDINKHPDLLKQILKDPRKWPQLLKNYSSQSENIEVRKAVIRSVLDELAKENIAAKGTVRSFRLNENEFIINDKRQSDAVQQRFKDLFIKEPGYTVYFGNAPRNGRGVFLSPDSL